MLHQFGALPFLLQLVTWHIVVVSQCANNILANPASLRLLLLDEQVMVHYNIIDEIS